jgi:hypothetical protein
LKHLLGVGREFWDEIEEAEILVEAFVNQGKSLWFQNTKIITFLIK